MSTILSSVCTHRAVSHVVRTHPNLITNRRDALRAYPRLGPLTQVLVTAAGARDAVSETVEIGTSAVSPDTSIRHFQPFFIYTYIPTASPTRQGLTEFVARVAVVLDPLVGFSCL